MPETPEQPPANLLPTDWAATPAPVQALVRTLIDLAQQSLEVHESLAAHALHREMYQDAQVYFEHTLSIAETLKEDRLRAQMMSNMCGVALALGEYAQAAGYAERAITLAEQLEEHQSEETARITLGNARLYLGDIKGAVASLTQALELARQRGSPGETLALIGLAATYSRDGQFDKAITCLHTAQAQAGQQRDIERVGFCRIHLATIFNNLGDQAQAIDYARQALAATAGLDLRRVRWQALVTLGNILAEAGEEPEGPPEQPAPWDEARDCFEQAGQLAEARGDSEGLLLAHINLAAVLSRQGRHEQAIDILKNQAQPLAERLADERSMAYCSLNLADTWVEQGELQGAAWAGSADFARAEAEYRQAAALLERVGDDEGLRMVYSRMGDLARRAGDQERAYQNYRRAIAHWERTRGLLREEQHRIGFLGRGLDPYHDLAELCIAVGRSGEALAAVEQARSRTLLDFLAYASLPAPSAGPELRALFDQEAQIAATLRGRHYALQNARGDERVALAREIDTLHQSWHTLLSRLAPVAPVYVALRRAEPAGWERLRDSLREAGAALHGRRIVLVEYFIARDTIHLFGLRADFEQPEVITLPLDHTELRRFVYANFGEHNKVCDLINDGLEELWHQYDYLIEPIAGWAAHTDIVYLAPHGLLHYLPLHALKLEGDYLIARNPVLYIPAASLLGYCQARRASDPTATPARRTAAIFGDSRGNLDYARTEAVGLGRLFGEQPLLGEAVTRAAFQAAATERDILHFAGHAGAGDPTQARQAALQLAGDTVLTTQDALALDNLGAQLVTLSGCETGVHESHPGDELIGLTRAFLYAGAPALVVSLWRVADRATAFLMERFYGYLRQEPALAAVDALRQAMLDTLAEPGWSSFYYWAPFILVGDWR